MKNLVEVVRGQRVEKDIGGPRYLNWATGKCDVRLRQEPAKPLLLQQLIFLYSNNNILAWLLANHGQDPVDLLVFESHRRNKEERTKTPEPAKGKYPFLNRNVWEDAIGIMQGDEDDNEDEYEAEDEDEEEEEGEWLEG